MACTQAYKTTDSHTRSSQSTINCIPNIHPFQLKASNDFLWTLKFSILVLSCFTKSSRYNYHHTKSVVTLTHAQKLWNWKFGTSCLAVPWRQADVWKTWTDYDCLFILLIISLWMCLKRDIGIWMANTSTQPATHASAEHVHDKWLPGRRVTALLNTHTLSVKLQCKFCSVWRQACVHSVNTISMNVCYYGQDWLCWPKP